MNGWDKARELNVCESDECRFRYYDEPGSLACSLERAGDPCPYTDRASRLRVVARWVRVWWEHRRTLWRYRRALRRLNRRAR